MQQHRLQCGHIIAHTWQGVKGGHTECDPASAYRQRAGGPFLCKLSLSATSQHQLKPAASMPSPPDPGAGSTKHTHDRWLLSSSAGIQGISSATKGLFLL